MVPGSSPNYRQTDDDIATMSYEHLLAAIEREVIPTDDDYLDPRSWVGIGITNIKHYLSLRHLIKKGIEEETLEQLAEEQRLWPHHGDKANCPVCGMPGRIDFCEGEIATWPGESIWYNKSMNVWECSDCHLK